MFEAQPLKRGSVRRRELDRQQDAIEVPADRANARRFAGTRRETGVRRLAPGDRQLDRAAIQNVLCFIPPGRGNFQRRNMIDVLPLDPGGLSVRGDGRGVWAVRQKRLG